MDTKTLLDVRQLFSGAWALTKERWSTFLVLSLLQGFVSTVFFIAVVAAAIGMGSTINDMGLAVPEDMFYNLISDFTVELAGVGLINLIGLILITAIFQGAILALATSQERLGVMEALRIGKQKWIPLTLAGLLVGLLVAGALGLLIIPGLVVAILLSFVSYEIVVAHQPILKALGNSLSMVKQHFWAVVGRILALGVLLVVTEQILTALIDGLVVSYMLQILLEPVISLFSSVFAVMYLAMLYHDIREATTPTKITVETITILSMVGWVVWIALGYFFAAFLLPELLHPAGCCVQLLP